MSAARRRRTAAAPLARAGTQLLELAVAAPQVVAHRVARMALAGPSPSARDRREFQRMGSEKLTAFQQSWWAMGMHAAMAQQRLALQWMGAWLWPWGARMPTQSWWHEGPAVLQKGLAPVHRRAVANAKRLRGTPLR